MDNKNMDLPQNTEFINNIFSQISYYTTPTTPSGEEDGLRNQAQHHPRLTQPSSAFPRSQLGNLKPLMLTLHCIFPNEFILALDILDRRLVRRIRTRHGTESEDGHDNQDQDKQVAESPMGDGYEDRGNKKSEEDFFFVTSASTIPTNTSRSSFPASRHGGDQRQSQLQKQTQWQEKGYEVRLQAWNCTCASFMMSAFRDLGPEPSSPPSSTSSSLDKTENVEGNGDNTIGHADHSNTDASADTSNTPAYSFGGTLPLHPESAPPVCKHILACLLAAICPGLGEGGREARDGRFVSLDREEIAALCAGWGG